MTEKQYCEYCQATVKDKDGTTIKNHLIFEKYVPHQYVYRRVCSDCVEKGEHKDLEEHQFSQCGSSIADDDELFDFRR